MRTFDLIPEVLAALRTPRPYPAITLAMPTDPKLPFDEKARILLRDLVTQAQRQLADTPDVEREVRLDLRDRRLDAAAIEQAVDAEHPADALVVYLAANEATQVWQIASPILVTPRVEFGSNFLTRYMVDAEQHSRPYLALVLDQEMCRLYRGAADRLAEVRGYGFPAPPRIPSPEDAIPGPVPRATPYKGYQEHVNHYLRDVDRHLGAALKAHNGTPLFVIGGEKILSAFRRLTGYEDLIVRTLPLTGMDTDTPAQLMRHLNPVIEEYRAAQVTAAMAELDAARSTSTYAGGVKDVWTAVADKRVYRLIVEEGLVVAGRIAEDGRVLETVPVPEPVTLPDPKEEVTPTEPDIATDVVEQLVEHAADADARIMFVPDGTLAEAGGVGAVLRY